MRLFRSACFDRLSARVPLLSIFALSIFSAATLAKEKEETRIESPSPSPFAAEEGLTNIPLMIGHEAKGLVLPDFDLDGHLRGKFEAGMARRVDENHVGFRSLKITTYTPGNTPDLFIEMSNSVLDLQTRVISSKERTEIKRGDFSIAGDAMEFNTKTRLGRLVGHVKMVITDQSHLLGKPIK